MRGSPPWEPVAVASNQVQLRSAPMTWAWTKPKPTPLEVISQLTPKLSARRAILSMSVMPPRQGTLARTMSTAWRASICEVEKAEPGRYSAAAMGTSRASASRFRPIRS